MVCGHRIGANPGVLQRSPGQKAQAGGAKLAAIEIETDVIDLDRIAYIVNEPNVIDRPTGAYSLVVDA